jgi:Icc-related predicted phosphoesterase
MTDSASVESSTVKTRVLIISDTHGLPIANEDNFNELRLDRGLEEIAFQEPLAEADVVLHCGDLTRNSRLEEYKITFDFLRRIKAPLKLVIGGNHDLALDKMAYRQQLKFYESVRGPSFLKEDKNLPRELLSIVESARDDGVHYLEEGTYEFVLQNGAKLRLYASPHTPVYGSWAFQYPDKHDFNIPGDVDIAMTHGPPRSVRDYTWSGVPAGCPQLFRAIYNARPKIHCYGHIHEAWGAELVTWRNMPTGEHIHATTVIDASKLVTIEKASSLKTTTIDDEVAKKKKLARRMEIAEQRGRLVNISSDGDMPLRAGQQTLFINASIMEHRYRPTNAPWIVDLDLPKSV